jgi:stage V sporulation protein G
MEVTEVRISRLTQGDNKLKGYAAVTFDDVFVVRDLKIIEGKKGLFVAMPSQKIHEPCPSCRKKNALRSKFCNECGHKLPMSLNRRQLHRDIAHPVNSDMRSYLQKVILEAFDDNQTASYDQDEVHDSSVEYDEGAAAGGHYEDEPRVEEDYLSRPGLKKEERVSRENASEQNLIDTIE